MRTVGRTSWWYSAVALIAFVGAAGCTDDDTSEPSAAGIATAADDAGGITVVRTVSETRPADKAIVVVVLEVPYDEFDSPSPADPEAIVGALGAAGFAPAVVTVQGSAAIGLEVLVDVAVERLPQAGEDIVHVVESAAKNSAVDSGVVFGVESCTDLIGELRRRAIIEAREEAVLLAAAADIDLGPVTAISEVGPLGFGPPSACPDAQDSLRSEFGSFGSFGSLSYEAFDAPAEAIVTTTLTVAFALQGASTGEGAPAAAVSVLGRGTVHGDADAAYVVVYVDDTAIEAADRLAEDLEDDLAEYGVLDGDVRVTQGYNALVQVRIDPERVADDGPDIVEAIEDELSDTYDSGVWFAADACPDILEESRAEAFEDATEQARSLAATADVELGSPILVRDASFDYLSIPPERCDSLPADVADDSYPIELGDFHDPPRVDLDVWLEVSFAIAE